MNLDQSQWPPLPKGTTVETETEKIQDKFENNEALKKELDKYKHKIYEVNIQATGLKIIADTPQGIKALKKVEKCLSQKGQEMMIEEATITCSSGKEATKPIQMLVFSQTLPAGPAQLQYYGKNKKSSSCSLRIVKAKGGTLEHR